MNDELDMLTDEQLSAVFAIEVAGWRYDATSKYWKWSYADGSVAIEEPDFATNADAVIPLLGCSWKAQQCEPNLVWFDGDFPCYGNSEATTFARAACIALIRAKRSERATR